MLGKTLTKLILGIFLGLVLVLVGGCSGQGFQLKSLAKTDIDMVADLHYQESELLLKKLTAKLYKRNPKYLPKVRGYTIDSRLQQLFSHSEKTVYAELAVSGVKAIELSLDPDFSGDRIFALMAGLTDMLKSSYSYQSEFFIYSELDGQKLYYSARNLEIALWRMKTQKLDHNEPLILTDSRQGEAVSHSYERLFGKLIGQQDILAKVVAGKNRRVIKTIAQNVAAMAFIPI